jgi:hypothetical protein
MRNSRVDYHVSFNNNPCSVTLHNFYDPYKYIGEFVKKKNGIFTHWNNVSKQYEHAGAKPISFEDIEKHKIYLSTWCKETIPECTEIIFDYRYDSIPKLPEQLKIYCCFDSCLRTLDLICLTKINFPIGLEYFCLPDSVHPDIVNKLKLPYGCKLIRISS